MYFRAGINPDIASPHLFLLPGPPRELQPMFTRYVVPILRDLIPESAGVVRRLYRIVNMGESVVEIGVSAPGCSRFQTWRLAIAPVQTKSICGC